MDTEDQVLLLKLQLEDQQVVSELSDLETELLESLDFLIDKYNLGIDFDN